jgi:hypothetical protein
VNTGAVTAVMFDAGKIDVTPDAGPATAADMRDATPDAPPAGGAGGKVTAQPKFCTHCGAPLKAGAKFCTNCGTKVGS